jgi:hypothetical protein
VLCYYDVFNHPLTVDEIERNLSIHNSEFNVQDALTELTDIGIVSTFEGYYFLNTKEKSIVAERLKKEALAKKMMRKSSFFSKLIGGFPFVEGVCISGSLSKWVMEEDGDIDYFVITKPHRLWICRSFLIIFKKVFLFNSHKYFCTNYFVDTNNLTIPDENIFTATEVSYLLPVINYHAYEQFMSANIWIKNHLPNTDLRGNEICNDENSKNILKRFSEFVLSGSLGEYADNLFFKITLKRWKKKFPHFNQDDFNLNLRTKKSVSKHHPRGYQQKVLQQYEERMEMVLEHLKNKTIKVA